MTSAQFNIYLMDAANTKRVRWTWRMGQTYFNVLYNHAPEIANHYRGGSLDPFYNDNLIFDFLYDLHTNFVKEEA